MEDEYLRYLCVHKNTRIHLIPFLLKRLEDTPKTGRPIILQHYGLRQSRTSSCKESRSCQARNSTNIDMAGQNDVQVDAAIKFFLTEPTSPSMKEE